MNLTDSAKLKVQKTYDSASDYYDAGPLGFWARYGQRTVERLGLPAGASVLDVACGTGRLPCRRRKPLEQPAG
jgi:ubiquinone/menaquinone biosynthesis C-methylase UbiE